MSEIIINASVTLFRYDEDSITGSNIWVSDSNEGINIYSVSYSEIELDFISAVKLYEFLKEKLTERNYL